MTLALQALVALPVVPGVAMTCHVATWFWAAREAQALGLCAVKAPIVTLGNIAAMGPLAAQPALLALPRSGTWNFAITPATPPDGHVLVWPAGGTHSAVVTAPNAITGYNQCAQFPVFVHNPGHTTGTPGQLAANQRVCSVVTEAAIVAAAAAMNL